MKPRPTEQEKKAKDLRRGIIDCIDWQLGHEDNETAGKNKRQANKMLKEHESNITIAERSRIIKLIEDHREHCLVAGAKKCLIDAILPPLPDHF